MENRIRITPKGSSFNIKELWRYRDLIWLLTRRSFVVGYKQTVLGPAWILLQPLLSSCLYAAIFGGIAGIGTEGVPKLLFYLTGSGVWAFFSDCVTKNAAAFTANAAVFGKVYFPRLTVPIANVCSGAIQLMVQLGLTVLILCCYLSGGQVAPNWMAWPLILPAAAQLGLLGLGMGTAVSALTTKYRDLQVLLRFGMQLWMYATPIVYPLSAAEGELALLLRLNPVTAPVELIRYALLGRGTVDAGSYGLSLLLTLAVAALGMGLFSKVERTFLDTV